ncbi:hypothetical protein FACS1894199_07750 [Bacteroidia bacterium]|nr:hypothetical protein FACS1894199_07750 [Bacteroidia bacterium]
MYMTNKMKQVANFFTSIVAYRNISTTITISTVFLLAVGLLSCDHTSVYRKFQSLPSEEWCMEEKPSFSFSISESQKYTVTIAVRHTKDYEIGNLWCFVQLSDSTKQIRRDTLNMMIAEPNGRWLGEGGKVKTVSKPIADTLHLEIGTYTVQIEQGMRVQCLEGVKDVGITVARLSEQ